MLKILKKKYFIAEESNKNDKKRTFKKNVSITQLFKIFT